MNESTNNHEDNNNNTCLHASPETIENFCDDVQYLWMNGHTNIPILDQPPSKFVFLRDYVSKNVPCIIRNAITTTTTAATCSDDQQQQHGEDSDAVGNIVMEKGNNGDDCSDEKPLILTLDDIVHLLTSSNDYDVSEANNRIARKGGEENETTLPLLTVDVTPDGHGDCIRTVMIKSETTNKKEMSQNQKMFVKPHEEQMDILTFRNRLRLGRQLWKRQLQQEKEPKKDEEGLSIHPLLMSEQKEEDREQDKCDGNHDENNDTFRQQKQIHDEEHPYPVLYYSRQNDCLRTELKPLFEKKLFPSTFHFAQEAFGVDSPDAINIWIGDERAVSSMHKDHYENLFYVLSGEKVFTLCPPADAPFLCEGEFPSGTFYHHQNSFGEVKSNGIESKNEDNEESWFIVPDYNDNDCNNKKDNIEEATNQETGSVHSFAKVGWILPDVDKILSPSSSLLKHKQTTGEYDVDDYRKRYPLLRHTHPIRVSVKEGEMLYLPSLWYHRVTQTKETVGINYWYDMRFDSPNWCYFNFLQQLNPFVVGSADTAVGHSDGGRTQV